MEKYQFPKIKDEIQFENFTRDLLNLIYQDNSFYLYGRKGQSQYGLDGYSTIHPIFFQCKHKSSPHIKDKKLEEELESEFNKAKPKIEEVSNSTESKFLFFTTHPNTTKLQDKARVLSTDSIIVEYWGWETIESHLNNLYLFQNRDFFHKYYPELAKALTASNISPQLTSKLGKSTIIGRKKELQEIDQQLNSSNTLLLINGIGGVGKSNIASYYLHSHKEQFDYYGFFEGLDSFIVELREPLDLKAEKANELLIEALSKLRKLEGKKLLVLDDVKNIEENQELLDRILELKHSDGYKILITSREEIEDIASYNLDVLSKDDAKSLFNSIYKIEDEVLLEEILGYLGYHAFFIEKTALSIKKTQTPQMIIDKFKNGEFAKISVKRKYNFNKFLGQLFSLDGLDDEEILMLKQLSALPSIEIGFEFLETVFQKKEDNEFEELLDYLCEKGWLTKLEGGYKLHQIIKEYLFSYHQPTFEEIKMVVDSLSGIMGKAEDSKEAIDNRENIIYFESLATLLDKLAIENENENEKVGDFFNNFGNIYHHLGFYQKAESLYQKSLKIKKKILGVEHKDVAILYNNLAGLYELRGEYQKAKTRYIKALKIKENVLREEDLSITISYNNLANIYNLMGEYQKAEPLYLKALKIKEKILGEENPSILISYNNLASLYKSMGEYREAESLHLKVLKISKKVLGEEHPSTATFYNNLAELYRLMGEYQKAEPLYLKALEIYEGVLGEEHPSTATIYNNLAVFYKLMEA